MPTNRKPEHADAVIVGGGPAGLAAALSLSALGFEKVVVLERGGRDFSTDWVRSYCYRIDGHGLQWFSLLGLEPALAKASVLNVPEACRIPPDGGPVQTFRNPVFKTGLDSYWLPRHELLEFLLARTQEGTHASRIDIRFGTLFTALSDPEDNKPGLLVSCRPSDHQGVSDPALLLRAKIVLGCDGSGSRVRRCLEEGLGGDMFKLSWLPHITAGRPYKALRLRVPADDIPEGILALVVGRDGSRLSFFPQRADRDRVVGGGSLGRENFENGADLRAYLNNNFPQIDWETALSNEMAQEFAIHPGSKFPEVRYAERLQMQAAGRGGVALLGDAVHVFPPDIGQGVNSAFGDVAVLHKALSKRFEGTEIDGSAHAGVVSDALFEFEATRLPDVKALAHLLPIGVPYQYRQPGGLHKFLWMADFLARRKASLAFPDWFYPPVIFSLQDPRFTYSDLISMHQTTTRRLMIATIGSGLLMSAAGFALYSAYSRKGENRK